MDSELVGVNVVVRRAPGVHRIQVTGDVDHVGAAALSRALDDAVAQHPDLIEVDLSGATFFCCAAVTALMDSRKATGGRLILVGAGDLVLLVLDVLGLTSAFERTGPPPS